jgi:hypothetical protein
VDDPFPAPQPAHNGQWQAPDYPDPAQVHPGQASQGYHFPPPEPDPNYGHHQALPPHQQWGAQPDPRGYDLGNYMPNGAQPYSQADPGAYQQGPYASQFGAAQEGYAESDNYGDEFLDDEDEPRRGRRWMFIAAALVGAIGIGGAMAYTYKSIIAPNSGRVPLVKAGDPNVKVRPDNRGDRKLARADERPAAPSQQDRTAEDGGPRMVRTIPIVPSGPAPAAEEEATGPAALPGMPGIMLDNRQRPPQAQPPREPAPARVAIGRPPQPQPPAVEPDDPPPARKPPVQVVPPVVAKPPPAVAPTPPAAPRPRATPAAASAAGAGYVAVLSSQKTRVDALKKFADLQQKHADVLNGKTPDVQEADLSARGLGTMYRLVVGPPGSREAASGICSQLRTAGQDCWVKEY